MSEPPTTVQPGAGADDPTEMPVAAWKQIAMRVRESFGRDHVTLSASGVAFHAFLALVPLVAAAVSIYGLIADPDNVRRLVDRLSGTVPADVTALIKNQLDSIAGANSSALGFGAVVGIVSGLWSASSGVSHLMEGINIAYDEDPDSRPFWRKRGVAVLLTLLVVSYLGASATVVTMVSAVAGLPGVVLQVLAWLVIAVGLGLVLAVFYRYGADRDDPEWEWASPGAVFSVVVWTAASFLFGLYVSNFGSYNETYGSLGAFVVVMLWLFISATVVIIGAEINTEIERQTREDSTEGPDEPIGERDATAADTTPASNKRLS